MESFVEIITFEEELYPCKKNKGFTHGRVVYYPEEWSIRFFNVNCITGDSLEVSSLAIKIKANPFKDTFHRGHVFYRKDKERVSCTMFRSRADSVTYYLARYNYILHTGTEIPVGYEVDHVDGIKLNDYISNLACITSEHNKEKRAYAFWLGQYNQETGERLVEADLVNTSVLQKVKDHFGEGIKDIRLERKNNNTKRWRENKREYVQEYAKKYREENADFVKDLQAKWRDENRESHNAKAREYRAENPDIRRRAELSRLISKASAKKWTKEVGELLIALIEEMFQLCNVTFEDLTNGLDTRKFKAHTINNLHRLKLLHYEQRTRLENPELYE